MADYWWIPGCGSLWIVLPSPSISYLNFVSITPSMGILFPILRRNEVCTLWSSFFMSFTCFANWILGILSFWANIHLSVSTDCVSSFVIGLTHSGCMGPETTLIREAENPAWSGAQVSSGPASTGVARTQSPLTPASYPQDPPRESLS